MLCSVGPNVDCTRKREASAAVGLSATSGAGGAPIGAGDEGDVPPPQAARLSADAINEIALKNFPKTEIHVVIRRTHAFNYMRDQRGHKPVNGPLTQSMTSFANRMTKPKAVRVENAQVYSSFLGARRRRKHDFGDTP